MIMKSITVYFEDKEFELMKEYKKQSGKTWKGVIETAICSYLLEAQKKDNK